MQTSDGGPAMDTCRLIQVIETTILRRGSGKDAYDPIRIVTQYWSTDGVLLAEVDPSMVSLPKRNPIIDMADAMMPKP